MKILRMFYDPFPNFTPTEYRVVHLVDHVWNAIFNAIDRSNRSRV
jgi:hypothetical protein